MSETHSGHEVELKYRLCSLNPLHAFSARLGPPTAVYLQHNYYYRSALAPDLMVRVRREASLDAAGGELEAKWWLTVKGKTLSKRAGVFVRQEDEAELTMDDGPLDSDPHRIDLLCGHALTASIGPAWSALGSLTNWRRVYRWQGLALELDETHFSYLDKPEWELEVETLSPQEDAQRVTSLLTEMGVVFVPQTHGKFSRFMRGLQQNS